MALSSASMGHVAQGKGAEKALVRRAVPRALLAEQHDEQDRQPHGVEFQIEDGETAVPPLPVSSLPLPLPARADSLDDTTNSIAYRAEEDNCNTSKNVNIMRVLHQRAPEKAARASSARRSASEESAPRNSVNSDRSAAPHQQRRDRDGKRHLKALAHPLPPPMPHYIRPARGHARQRRFCRPGAERAAPPAFDLVRARPRFATCLPEFYRHIARTALTNVGKRCIIYMQLARMFAFFPFKSLFGGTRP